MVHATDLYFLHELSILIGGDESRKWFATRNVTRSKGTNPVKIADQNRDILSRTQKSTKLQREHSLDTSLSLQHPSPDSSNHVRRAKSQPSFSDLCRCCTSSDVPMDHGAALLALNVNFPHFRTSSAEKCTEQIGLLYTDAAHLVLDKYQHAQCAAARYIQDQAINIQTPPSRSRFADTPPTITSF